ncbi:MAG: hypothetical protein LAT61_14240 [Alcanivorax sp.]|nr:hypothetical protein [Alcanivorax sp.]
MSPVIGNVTPWGTQGYTILEEGELSSATHRLEVKHYLVADRSGETLPQRFPSLEVARRYIESISTEHSTR